MKRIIALALLGTTLTGCTNLAPKPELRDLPVAPTFPELLDPDGEAVAAQLSYREWFTDPRLEALVDEIGPNAAAFSMDVEDEGSIIAGYDAISDRLGAPDTVIATRYVDRSPAKGVAMQRPLCAYPAKAWWRGTGDTNDAANFVCAVSKPR